MNEIATDNFAADELKILIEATLLAAGRPLTEVQLLELFDERQRPTDEQLSAAFAALAVDYETRGIELCKVATGWRIQIRPKCVDMVSRLWQERASRYSRALLETLALIAYRQPITRSEIEEIRGVAISSSIMRTIQERNWIRVVGHREVPGRPELLGTTKEFLDYFGLRSLDQLPTLAELRDVENIGVQLELPSSESLLVDTQITEAETVETDLAEIQTSQPQADDSSSEDETADGTDESSADTLQTRSADDSDDNETPNAPTMVAEGSIDEDGAPALYAPSGERDA